MSEFTKGPWVLRVRNIDSGEFFVEARRLSRSHPHDIEIMADDVNEFYPVENKLADARLICASPDLYEALKYLVEDAEKYDIDLAIDESIQRAKLVLAKARGES